MIEYKLEFEMSNGSSQFISINPEAKASDKIKRFTGVSALVFKDGAEIKECRLWKREISPWELAPIDAQVNISMVDCDSVISNGTSR